MRFNKIVVGTCVALVLALGLAVGSPHVATLAHAAETPATVSVAVGAAVRYNACLRCS
jgi:hypothetical protein